MSVHIIAEAGSNHNGSMQRAQELVKVAQVAKADSIKFQWINADGLYVPQYVDGDLHVESRVHQQRTAEQIPIEQWAEVWLHAQSTAMPISASVFDIDSIDPLIGLGIPYIKIASTDLSNGPLIDAVCRRQVPMIVSTGMATLGEIEQTVRRIEDAGALGRLTILHCVSVYPCELADAGLQRINTLVSAFGVPVGYSDHTLGSTAACMAVAMGATVIEKHLTTDRSLPGFDHAHAADPESFANFVSDVRSAEAACKRKPLTIDDAQKTTRTRARRGLYATGDLPAGHVITEGDIACVRPSSELGSDDISLLVGQRLEEPIKRHEPFGIRRTAGVGKSNWHSAENYWTLEMAQKQMLT